MQADTVDHIGKLTPDSMKSYNTWSSTGEKLLLCIATILPQQLNHNSYSLYKMWEKQWK